MISWLLFPGWSFSSRALEPFAAGLCNSAHQVMLVDLEDTLRSSRPPETLLDQMVLQAASHVEGGAFWLGWSLGGLIALRALQRVPEKVRGAVLLASSPKFVAGDSWPGLAQKDLKELYHQIERHPAKGVRRFDLLTASGDRTLLKELVRRPVWSKQALLKGLELLAEIDLREVWRTSGKCTLFFAQKDALLPASLVSVLRRLNPKNTVLTFEGHHLFPLVKPREAARKLLGHYGT